MADYQSREKLAKRKQELEQEELDNSITLSYYSSYVKGGKREVVEKTNYKSGRTETTKTVSELTDKQKRELNIK